MFTISSSVTRLPPLCLLAALCFLSVKAASRCEANPAYYDFSIGDINATILSDGLLFFNITSIFKVAPIAVRRAFDNAFIPSDPLAFENNILYLRTLTHRILIDAGSGTIFQTTAGQLFRNLEDAGIAREDINAIVITHAHADHIGGLITSDREIAFPNAKIYISRKEFNFWTTNPVDLSGTELDERGKAAITAFPQMIFPLVQDQIELVDPGDRLLPGIRFVDTAGHTPGHLSVIVESKGESLFAVGDSFDFEPVINNPEWENRVDPDGPGGVETRFKILDLLADSRMLTALYHGAWPGLGYVQRLGWTFDWTRAGGVYRQGVKKTC